MDDIERQLERPVDLCISTHSDVSFAVQRGYERLENAEVADSPVGQRLLERGSINPEQLRQALAVQRRSHLRLGDVLLQERVLPAARLTEALERYAVGGNGRFGAFLVQHDYISLEQLQTALEVQRSRFRRLGEVLLDLEMISRPSLEQALEEAS